MKVLHPESPDFHVFTLKCCKISQLCRPSTPSLGNLVQRMADRGWRHQNAPRQGSNLIHLDIQIIQKGGMSVVGTSLRGRRPPPLPKGNPGSVTAASDCSNPKLLKLLAQTNN